MIALRDAVFHTRAYETHILRRKAQLTYAVLVFILFVAPLVGLFIAFALPDIPVLLLLAGVIASLGGAGFGIVRVQQGHCKRVSQWSLTGLSISWTFLALITDAASPSIAIWPLLLIVLSALLLDDAGFRFIGIGLILAYTSVAAISTLTQNRVAFDVLIVAAYMLTVGISYVVLDVIRALQRNEEQYKRTSQDKLVTINQQIIQQAAKRNQLKTALDVVLQSLLDHFEEIYHAQVFIISPDKVQANLLASTGPVGQKLLERDHNLAVGSLSIIGQVTLRKEAVIARVDTPNSVHRPNDLLPETRLEAAFPLVVEGEIIGALDIQSRAAWDFSADDEALFQGIANHLSLMIDNIQQYETSQRNLEENKRLAEQARRAMFDAARLNKRLIGRAWSEYLTGKAKQLSYAADFIAGTEEDTASEWTATSARAAQQNTIVQDGPFLSVPLRVRGEVVGAMEFELEADQMLAPEDLEMVQEISERFGLTADNTRLVEESQRAAQREVLINEISSRLQASNNVEATMTEAARNLSETLQASRVAIKLGKPSEPANSNGSKT